jgi:hypothetical protein
MQNSSANSVQTCGVCGGEHDFHQVCRAAPSVLPPTPVPRPLLFPDAKTTWRWRWDAGLVPSLFIVGATVLVYSFILWCAGYFEHSVVAHLHPHVTFH